MAREGGGPRRQGHRCEQDWLQQLHEQQARQASQASQAGQVQGSWAYGFRLQQSDWRRG